MTFVITSSAAVEVEFSNLLLLKASFFEFYLFLQDLVLELHSKVAKDWPFISQQQCKFRDMMIIIKF